MNGKMLPEVRHRSLYSVTLYRSNLSLSGVFDPGYIQKLGIAPSDIVWSDCQLLMGLDDARGLEALVRILLASVSE